MAWFWRRWMLVVPVMAGLAAPVCGQAGASEDIETALHQMADRADVIFVGQVISVGRVDGGNVASGVVEVQFRVDQAVKGCAAGTPYTLREWAGLWTVGTQRYRVGQRLLMMLHAPGAGGMSSPVDGLDGAIPIVRGGSGALAAGSSARMAPPAVDLRWVGAKMSRPVAYASGAQAVKMADPGKALQAAARAVAGTVEAAPSTGLSVGLGQASVPTQQASVDAVVGMLSSWGSGQSSDAVQHAAR